MADVVEVVFTSDSSGHPWNACVWDPDAGTSLMHYKNGSAAPHTMCLAGTDYLLSAEPGKPCIRAWALNKHEQVQLRMICPGPVSALACTSDGLYCAAGIGETIYVWQTATGFLVGTATGHFQNISCLKFTDSGVFLISGGEDSQVRVWDFSRLIKIKTTSMLFCDSESPSTAQYVMTDHTFPVVDICVGKGGVQTLMASVSMDNTCKVYSLASGVMLLNIIFPTGLTAVALNSLSTEIFVGAATGKIYSYVLSAAPRTLDYHIPPEYPSVFYGHNKPVICLSTSMDGRLLISGAQDGKAIIWDVASNQMLRSLAHKEIVTNAFFAIAPKNVFNEDLHNTIVLKNFLRTSSTEKIEEIEVIVRNQRYRSEAQKKLDSLLKEQDNGNTVLFGGLAGSSDHGRGEELQKALQVNAQLYKFAVEELLKPKEKGTETEGTSQGLDTSDILDEESQQPRRGKRKRT